MARFEFNKAEAKRIGLYIDQISGFENLSWYRKVMIPRVLKKQKKIHRHG